MHPNSTGTSSVLRVLATAQLTDAFQLVAETEEAEVLSGSKFEELVPAVLASNSNTTSTQDCGVFSLSTRSFLSPFLETNKAVSLS